MFAVGLAGYVEMHGKEASAQKLLAMAQRLSDQVQKEAEAAEEAKNATKN
jgi:hypothetical protein